MANEINYLNNFYKEFGFDSEKFETLLQFYGSVFDALYYMMDQTIDNKIFKNMETYRYIPMQAVSTTKATYKIEDLLSELDIIKQYNLYDLTQKQKIDLWQNSMSTNDKINILKQKNKYLELTTIKNGLSSDKHYDIVDFDLYSEDDKLLIKNLDYVYKDEKIYLFREIARYSKKVLMKNIAIDYNLPENIIGKNIYVPYQNFLTKNEYREIVYALFKVALGGFTIKNLNDALNIVGGSEGFKVIDRISANQIQKSFWGADNEISPSKLNRFDFIVYAPLDIIINDKKLKMVTDFLNIIKESDVGFYISPFTEFNDALRLNRMPLTYKHKIKSKGIREIINAKDYSTFNYAKCLSDKVSLFDILNNDISLKQTDKIKASTIKKYYVKFTVLNNNDSFDKIKAIDNANKNVQTACVDKMINAGTIHLYDSGYLYDEDLTVINYDDTSYDYMNYGVFCDSVTMKLIPKS